MFFFFASVEEPANPIFAPFENNLINWLVLVVLIIWLGNKYIPPLMAARRERINAALQEATQARLEGQAFFQEQQQKIANAEREADTILVEAKQIADTMRTEMEAQTQKDIKDLETKIENDIINQRQQAITQLRSAAARAAIALTEQALPQAVTDQSRHKLMSDFMHELGESRN